MICDNCMNNPKNNPFASGACNCALPDIERQTKPPDVNTAEPRTYITTAGTSTVVEQTDTSATGKATYSTNAGTFVPANLIWG